jgi:hypothetical protein
LKIREIQIKMFKFWDAMDLWSIELRSDAIIVHSFFVYSQEKGAGALIVTAFLGKEERSSTSKHTFSFLLNFWKFQKTIILFCKLFKFLKILFFNWISRIFYFLFWFLSFKDLEWPIQRKKNVFGFAKIF